MPSRGGLHNAGVSTRALTIVLALQLALGITVIALLASGRLSLPGAGDAGARATAGGPCPGGRPPRARGQRFDGRRAFALLERQVRIGPRPAGSAASRRLAQRLRRALPRGRFQAVPGGLRNVVGTVAGRDRTRRVVIGAHYDTKDMPGFVGANDGAGGTAAVVELARSTRPRTIGPTLVFVLFDGEESPAGTPNGEFEARGLRGSKVAARAYRGAEAMILLDFVADRRLSIPREGNSNPALWSRLRAAAQASGVGCAFPAQTGGAVIDDHVPFLRAGVPAIDLIDFGFDCFHRRCDDLSAVSERSLDASGEAVAQLISTLR